MKVRVFLMSNREVGMENILNVRNLNVYYKNKETLLSRFRRKSESSLQHVLKNVSFDMKKERCLGLSVRAAVERPHSPRQF